MIHTFAELDNPPTFISVPTYTASFDRKVELSVNPAFTTNRVNASVDLEEGKFSAAYPTTFIQPGERTIYARALQGGIPSATDAVPFTLTT